MKMIKLIAGYHMKAKSGASEVYLHPLVGVNSSHIINQDVHTFDKWITIWYH